MPVLQLRDILLFSVPLVVSASTLAAMHWFPWNRGAAYLTRVEAYVRGTLIVVGIPLSTMAVSLAMEIVVSLQFWMALLLVNTIVSGAVVKLAYWIDDGKVIGLEDKGNGDIH